MRQQAGRDRVREHEQPEADRGGDGVHGGFLGCGEQREADRARAVVDDRGDGHQAERQGTSQRRHASDVGSQRGAVAGGGERRQRDDAREDEREQHRSGRWGCRHGGAGQGKRQDREQELLHSLRLHVLSCPEVADEAHGERAQAPRAPRRRSIRRARPARCRRRRPQPARGRRPGAEPRRAPRAAHRESRRRGLRRG